MKSRSFSLAFGRVLRRERSARNMSQERLAHAAGLARQFVGMLERGERRPTLDVANALAKALGLTLSSLIRETEKALVRPGS